jgi:hypothetical protein
VVLWWSGLFGGADEQFVDGDVAGAGDDVASGVGDVLALQSFDVADGGGDLLQDGVGVVGAQFGVDAARLDDGDADVRRRAGRGSACFSPAA